VKDGVARTPEGNLSGGTCFLGESVKRLTAIGIPAEDAVRMASQTPADRLKMNRLGRLVVGAEDHMAGLYSDGRVKFILAEDNIYSFE